jgi:hypothetical protein
VGFFVWFLTLVKSIKALEAQNEVLNGKKSLRNNQRIPSVSLGNLTLGGAII